MISSHMLDIPNVVAFLIERFVIQYEFPSFVQTYHRSMLSTYFLGLNSSAQFILLFLFGAIFNFMYLVLAVALRAFLYFCKWGATLQLPCTSFSLRWLLLSRSTGSRACGPVVAAPRLQSTGSIVVMHGLNCSEACNLPGAGIQPLYLPLLHQQADALPLSHQGSPQFISKINDKGLPCWSSG